MRVKIKKRIQADCIEIIPESRDELLELHNLWSDNGVQLMKIGCVIHGDGKTIHSIANSKFSILIRRT